MDFFLEKEWKMGRKWYDVFLAFFGDFLFLFWLVWFGLVLFWGGGGGVRLDGYTR